MVLNKGNNTNIYTVTYTAPKQPTIEYKKIIVDPFNGVTEQRYENKDNFFKAINDEDSSQLAKLTEQKKALEDFADQKEKSINEYIENKKTIDNQREKNEQTKKDLLVARGIVTSLFGENEKTKFIDIAQDIYDKVPYVYGNNEKLIIDNNTAKELGLKPASKKQHDIYNLSLTINDLEGDNYLKKFKFAENFLTAKYNILNESITRSSDIGKNQTLQTTKNKNLGTLSAVNNALKRLIEQIKMAINSTEQQIMYRTQLDTIKKDNAYTNLFKAVQEYNTTINSINNMIREKIDLNIQQIDVLALAEKAQILHFADTIIEKQENEVQNHRTSLQNNITQNYKALNFAKNIESEPAYATYLEHQKQKQTLINKAKEKSQKIVQQASQANLTINIQQ